MIFDDFAKMNEALGVVINRKDLRRIFNSIDRNKNGKLRLEEIKNISRLLAMQDEESQQVESSDWKIEEEGLKGNEIIIRQKINDIYDDLKNKIEAKNYTLEQVFFNELKFDPIALATTSGVR
jgi:hypothetical protein